MSKIISLVRSSRVNDWFPEEPHGPEGAEAKQETMEQRQSSPLCREDLLKHYVQEGVHVLQGLDQLGNFLMGFGVLVLGYLLNVPLKMHFVRAMTRGKGQVALLSWVGLCAWVMAVLLLLGFMYLFIFHMLAGRTVHVAEGDDATLGQRITQKHLSYREFASQAHDFDTFVANHYLPDDQNSPTQLWYATFRYTRYMAFCKLMIMNKMRSLLAWAMLCGVVFKIAAILS